MDNQTLILALKNGSEEAFTSLYHKYCDKVYKFCRLYYTNDSTTEEVVQEVFIKLWDIRSYVNENENLEGLLFIITRNMIFSNSKKNFNETFYKMSILAAYDKAYDIEEELDAADLKNYIDKLISQLPARRQQIFRMSREEHLSNREIAERCAVSEKAIERQITLALKFIKENLPLFVVFMG